MYRDLSKAIRAYRKRFGNAPNNTGAFFCSDVMQIVEMCDAKGVAKAYDVAMRALEAGFWIGYKTAKRGK